MYSLKFNISFHLLLQGALERHFYSEVFAAIAITPKPTVGKNQVANAKAYTMYDEVEANITDRVSVAVVLSEKVP
jgi:hypothetical protein